MQKRGQATAFLAIAIAAIIVILLAVILFQNKPLLPVSYENDVKSEFEACLQEKLSFAIVDNNFIIQPSLVLAKQYLEGQMNNAALQCSSIFSMFEDLTIIPDNSRIKSTISFNNAESFNDIIKISMDLTYPLIIKKKGIERRIGGFSVSAMP